MAESNATQVILTDDGIRIINAQNTADNAASQAGNADSAALIAQSMANAAKVAADSNYDYANSEIAVQSTATAKAQSTADNAFSQAQAVGSQASAEIQNNSTATAKAQSTADNAFSQAQAVGSQASAEIQNNSTATAKAQSTADNAFSQATTAIDNGQAVSQAVTSLKDGSTLTIAELGNGLATKVSNSEYASYKDQTASQIGQLVTNSAFSAYQTQTADLIASKVATKDFSAYQATTAKSIESKVESSDFNTYKTQTADLIDDKVSSSEYASDKTQTASEIADRVSNSAFSTYQTQTASQIASKVDNGDFSTYKTQTADLIASKVATKDFSAYQATTAKAISSKVESSDFNTYKTQTADLIDDKVSSSEYASDKTQTASEIADRVSNSAFSTYQTQTASQIASKVDNGDFSTYKTQTADLIASKLATKDFSAYQATTAKSIESKVESSDFNTYKTQTADTISQTVTNAISNISIGGVNLLRNSDFNPIRAPWAYSTSHVTMEGNAENPVDVPANNKTILIRSKFDLAGNGSYDSQKGLTYSAPFVKAGTTYTFSAFVRGSTSETTSKWVAESNGTRFYFDIKPGEWQRVSGQITFQTDKRTLYIYQATAGTPKLLCISSPKLETGTMATDWSPAPEDLATQSQITQLSGDINLRVTKDDLIDQINLQAGKTLISSSGQLTLAADTIYFDTKKPVIIPSANITGTLTGKTINASTINGTTFHGGDMISNSNNTAGYYPMTITPDGAYNSTYFDSKVALRASVQSGAILYDYRSMLPNDNGKYIYSNTLINGQGVTIESGHTDTKDSTFNAKRTGRSYISLTPSGGLMLSGPNSNIDFAGMYMNPYGNIVGKSSSAYWQVSKAGNSNSGGGVTARFGIDTGDKGTINFYRPLFVDEIGGFTSSNGHALFIHGDDNGTSGSTGQMIFRKDGRSAQVVSASIYNRTYSGGSNVTVTSYGTLGRITSASKYKLDITKETSISPANKLLSIDMSSWIDKSSAEQLSDSKTNGTDLSEPEMNVFRHYGLIAEDLIKAGLDEFVIKGDNGQAEGIEYDRLWTVLIPKIRQLSNDQIQNKMTIAKLGSEIEELKQGR